MKPEGTEQESLFRFARALWEKCMGRLNTTYYRCRYPQVKFGKGVIIRGRLIIKGSGHVTVGDWSCFASESNRPNKITTGSNEVRVMIADRCYLNGVELTSRAEIEIGAGCMIGEALVMDTDFHSVEIDRRGSDASVKNRAVRIAENVWIGTGAMILKGVSIGKNSVIGAGAVVRQPVPENVVVIGNPAQVVKRLIETKSTPQLEAAEIET
jgi:acetyltransferase-like isoleucine patch superfamily enzyme